MVKKVYKYGTGQVVPEGAEYLCSKKNGEMPHDEHIIGKRYYVWHYFLVDEEEPIKPPVTPREKVEESPPKRYVVIGDQKVDLNGKSFVIKVDTFSHEDYFGGYFNSNQEAIKHAEESGENMLKAHAYDKDGKHIGSGGRF